MKEEAISTITNTFLDFKENAVGIATHYTPMFNPADTIVEIQEKANKEKGKEITTLKKEIEKLTKGTKEINILNC